MHRIDTPGSSGGTFVSGNPFAGIEGTILGPDWLNAVQEEIAGPVESAGITLSKQDNGQLERAIELLRDEATGRRMDFTAGADLTAGEGVVVGDVFGTVEVSVLNGQPAVLLARGTPSLPKTSSLDNITQGLTLYWDGSGVVLTSPGNREIGSAHAASGPGNATVVVMLKGPPNPTL